MDPQTDFMYECVNHDLRNQANKYQLEHLHENIDGWYDTLIALKRDTELHLTSQKSLRKLNALKGNSVSIQDFEREEQRRIKSIKFIVCIESKIAHVKSLKRKQHAGIGQDIDNCCGL